MRRRTAVTALLVVVCALVAGCGGVPTSSKPEKVGSVAVSNNPTPLTQYRPTPADGVLDTVQHFLAENYSTQDDHHANAQAFLTPGAQKTWLPDANGTTIVDSIRGVSSPTPDTVKLTAHKIGMINPDGTYTPDLAGDGSGTNLEQFEVTFQLKRVNGVWLIVSPPSTLVVDQSTFNAARWAHTLYFVDLAKRNLIPDVRYSPLTDPLALAQWELSLLKAPNPLVQLSDAVTPVLPNLAQSSGKVTAVGQPTLIALPGSSTLDPQQRELLAAQLAASLGRTQSDSFQLTDGGKPVPISGSDTTFTAADFPLSAALVERGTQPSLMYVDQGGLRVVGGGVDLPKSLTSEQNQFAAVAVAQQQSSTDLLVSGTTTGGRLLAGTGSAGLSRVDRLPPNAALSRPDWAPGLGEVWVGAGSQLFRAVVAANGKPGPAAAVPVNLPTTQAAISQIKALRFSPEGSRIALVVQTKGGNANQLWFGTVVRSTTSTNTFVEGLRQISPAQVSVSDVGWFDSTTLVYAAANQAQGNAPGIWQIGVDGSGLTSRGTDGLPQLPEAIAQVPRTPTYASVGGQLYLQLGSWKPQSSGSAPVYVE